MNKRRNVFGTNIDRDRGKVWDRLYDRQRDGLLRIVAYQRFQGKEALDHHLL